MFKVETTYKILDNLKCRGENDDEGCLLYGNFNLTCLITSISVK